MNLGSCGGGRIENRGPLMFLENSSNPSRQDVEFLNLSEEVFKNT